uniref:G-protein coupled receptors family 2 profile 2 domain-containing protein n=1 Tax=Clastoptera arizonana TaxID=38151 RepID=A0A1B6DN44_9HEMI
MMHHRRLQMLQAGVATWCWLLALGLGSGVHELNQTKKTPTSYVVQTSVNITDVKYQGTTATPAHYRQPPLQRFKVDTFIRMKHDRPVTTKPSEGEATKHLAASNRSWADPPHATTIERPIMSRPLNTKRTTEGPVVQGDEYYTSYVEYPEAIALNHSAYREESVIPEPNLDTDDDLETDALLPDDSLADTDLHDHDLIDSVMYIYFGASDRDDGGVGKQVLIVGAVISLVAQLLTLACVLRRLQTHADHSQSLIIINAEAAAACSSLTYMLGIQATAIRTHCQLVAVVLHYLHLATCGWYFVNCINAYRHVLYPEHRTKVRLYCLMAWTLPAIIVMMCFLLNERGYETRVYCWMSLEKGMLFSFMIPVSVLILMNTFFALSGLRGLSLSKSATDVDRKCLRVAATLLPMFSVVWFLGVVALENSTSLVFPFLFVTMNCFMNWFIFACWLPPDISVWKDSDDEYDDEDDDMYDEVLKPQQQPINDVQPLLEEAVYVCGRRDACELQMDPICTISS